jgi:two-component system cell cycle sensor histidine kinase/response regulator CckA
LNKNPDDAAPAPRPAGADEILQMMEQRAVAARSARPPRRSEGYLAALLIGALFGLAIAAGLVGLSGSGLASSEIILIAGATAIAGVCVAGLALRLLAPPGFGRAVMRRAVGGDESDAGVDAGRLAGADMLTALGLAEQVLESDEDARLVTRRDGVVLYANAAYSRLAADAGVVGPAGLPPRIDRLFAQQGAESTKVFRLCRAAKSAAAAVEIVYQVIGLAGGGRRRRFETSVRPIPGADEYVVWRLRELAVEEERHDALAAAFADYVRPVFAIEKSGQIPWANAAMRAALGVDRSALRHIDEIVLGESSEIVRRLLQVDGAPAPAKVRGRDGEPAEARFRAFRRGGLGEGFVAVELEVEAPAVVEEADAGLPAELAEAPFGVAVVEGDVGADARVIEVNKAFSEIFGGVKKNAPLSRLLSGEALAELAAEIRKRSGSGALPRAVETSVKSGGGAYAVYARPARRRRGGYGGRRTVIYATDVSERKLMEAEHRRDQKLAAIGKLTGEIAHDFNNLLQVVLGNCERLMLRHPAGDPDFAELGLIRGNAMRASNMIRQLLAFSRSQTLKREILSMTELLRDWAQFLNRAVGEKVQIELVNGRGLPPVRVDRNQFESALMNLAVNARDAMGPSGGKLTIRTSLATAAEIAAAGVPNLGSGDHLLIEVSDTGPGVPQEIRDKIFDPFFTTKEDGKGTGLGLATVYGLVTQMDGAITVGDAPGGGALFRIFLPGHDPADAAAPVAAPLAASGPVDLTGVGRILVVEDEDSVRNFVVAALEDCGYEVTTAADAEEALEFIGAEPKGFDVVVSDVMMPDIDGPTMVAKARAEHGLSAKVLFMSAYAESTVREQIDSLDQVGYIQKPFTLKGLAAKVKEAMQERRRDEAA